MTAFFRIISSYQGERHTEINEASSKSADLLSAPIPHFGHSGQKG